MSRETWLLIRYVAIALLGIVGIPFVVSTPRDPAFWVTMGVVIVVMLPGIGVMAYFHRDIRRIRSEQNRAGDGSQ